MMSPSHSPGNGMLEVTVIAWAYAVSEAARACATQQADKSTNSSLFYLLAHTCAELQGFTLTQQSLEGGRGLLTN